jgi:hypothetical protein
MIATPGRFCPNHFFDNLFHCFVVEARISGQFAVGKCMGPGCSYKEEKEKCVCFT